jgi:hypothetical protein
VLYVGDFDPSGMYMPEEDLPARFAKYDGDHRVEREIKKLIEPVAWQRCATVNAAEQESLKTILEKWGVS